MRKKLSRTTVYLLLICAFLFIVNLSLGLVLTRQSSTAMRALIESRMLDVSNTAAAMLDGDVLCTLEAEDRETPEYQEAFRILSSYEENIELEYIYCIRDLKDGNFVFLIDPDAVDPGEFGEHIPYTDALYQASLGTPSVDKVPYQDDWGRFYSAYSPVYNSKNEVAGIVAVDFSAEWYENQVSNQVRTTLLVTVFSQVFAGIIIALIAARSRSRFNAMLHEMNRVSDGIETLVHEVSPGIALKLHQEEPTASNDEITELGNRIRSLEQQLGENIAFVRAQAFIDGLTGLGNRTAYEAYLNELEEEIQNGTACFALVVMDLNGLKEINDTLGHEQGDRAISAVGDAMKRVFGGERLYRIGGDEFLVLVSGDGSDLPPRLAQLDRVLAEGGSAAVSKGCASFVPGQDRQYQEVFRRADQAMYEDKKAYYAANRDRRRR